MLALKGLYPALCALQEIALRQMAPQLSFVSQYKHLIPNQFHWIFHSLTVGVVATYTGGVPVYPRTRGLPYQSSNEQHCLAIGEKFWKDIVTGRMFVCTTGSMGLHAPLEATPTTMVDKKNPDRTISLDKRMIADLRRVNLSFPGDQYYKATVPTVSEIARDVLRLQALNPNTPIALAKRDIAAAFRLLRLHHALSLVMATELPGRFFGIEGGSDLVLIYLAMPFGWNGSPAHFAAFGDALTVIHHNFGISDPSWFGSHPFHSRLYVGDGIFAEVLRIQRMNACTGSWERIAKGLLGPTAINLDKLGEEGIWKQIHVILGFVFYTSNMTITLPEAKIASAQTLIEGILQWKNSQVMLIKAAQQLRGCMEHFSTTNQIWKILSTPVDELLTYTDENNEWASCPHAEIWTSFWHSMSVLETCMEADQSWRALFHGSLFRLLPLHERLALKMEVQPFVWVTVDATLEYIGGVSWHGNECFRMSATECKRICGLGSDIVLKIGECEMLAAALAIVIWGIKDGVTRNIILCADNRNVLHWMKKGKAKQGESQPYSEMRDGFHDST